MAYTAIDDPEAYFQAVLYTGNASGDHAITLPGDTDMQPDMVWIKERTATSDHFLTDIGLGVGGGGTPTRLEPSANSAESAQAFTVQSDGFTLVTTTNQVNQDGILHVAWCWKESATSGFDIATFTGNGAAQNISHSLSAVPKMVITKSRSTTGAWYTYHAGVASDAETDYLVLDTNAAVGDASTVWNDTAPTSSVFTVGSGFDDGTTYIAYAFAPKPGFSKFGSYEGNGLADGTFVYLGFRPAYVLFKGVATNREWIIADNKRDTYNLVDEVLYANTNDAAGTSAMVDFLSNGFKFRHAAGPGTINTADEVYIYAAFAEAPFVNSNGVPCNAR